LRRNTKVNSAFCVIYLGILKQIFPHHHLETVHIMRLCLEEDGHISKTIPRSETSKLSKRVIYVLPGGSEQTSSKLQTLVWAFHRFSAHHCHQYQYCSSLQQMGPYSHATSAGFQHCRMAPLLGLAEGLAHSHNCESCCHNSDSP